MLEDSSECKSSLLFFAHPQRSLGQVTATSETRTFLLRPLPKVVLATPSYDRRAGGAGALESLLYGERSLDPYGLVFLPGLFHTDSA